MLSLLAVDNTAYVWLSLLEVVCVHITIYMARLHKITAELSLVVATSWSVLGRK